jgi:predicted nucleic-acid-binding protein
MRAVDTKLLVRVLVRDDAKQAAAADTFVGPGAWISHLVLVESLWVLASVYGAKPPQIAAAVAMLLEHKELAVQDSVIVSAALKNFRAHPSVSFSDCIILEIARKAGHLPLGTFDRALSKLDGTQRL